MALAITVTYANGLTPGVFVQVASLSDEYVDVFDASGEECIGTFKSKCFKLVNEAKPNEVY